MIKQVLLLTYYLTLFLFGIATSFSFSNINLFETNKKPWMILCFLSMMAQLISWLVLGSETTWRIYPLITHIPIVFVLWKYYKKRIIDALTSVACAYLLCQPSKWLGILFVTFTNNVSIQYMVRIATLVGVGYFLSNYFLTRTYPILGVNKKRNIVFSIVPVAYYCYDYSTSVYNLHASVNPALVLEFLPLILCLSYFYFLLRYHYEYEQKMIARQNVELNHVIISQQKKEMETIKNTDEQVRLLRHDMRHLINNTMYSLQENNVEAAMKMLSGFNDLIETTYVESYCENEMLNYIISYIAAKCEKEQIRFEVNVKIPETLPIDETILVSILSNGIENAINAQKTLPNEKKVIYLYLKTKEDKILLSIKNPFDKRPVFEEGMPISNNEGHGYGSRSIKYLTESLGGSCEFLVKDDLFVLRMVV